MGAALEIQIKPIPKNVADQIVKKYHYSGKVVSNSTLNLGVLYQDKLYGAMQLGSPMDKSKILPLVSGTEWNNMIELNRMAFSDVLPRNSESRAISLAIKWIKKNAPHIEWIVSFADGTQCGHGTIYQAANFHLTQIKKNTTIIQMPNGDKTTWLSVGSGGDKYGREQRLKGYSSSVKFLNECYPGWKKLEGYMYRYIYFVNPKAKKRYIGEFVPFSKIKELNIQMYKGQWVENSTTTFDELKNG